MSRTYYFIRQFAKAIVVLMACLIVCLIIMIVAADYLQRDDITLKYAQFLAGFIRGYGFIILFGLFALHYTRPTIEIEAKPAP